eukprot:1154416-Pelagomonas_calceolata.AAC.3
MKVHLTLQLDAPKEMPHDVVINPPRVTATDFCLRSGGTRGDGRVIPSVGATLYGENKSKATGNEPPGDIYQASTPSEYKSTAIKGRAGAEHSVRRTNPMFLTDNLRALGIAHELSKQLSGVPMQRNADRAIKAPGVTTHRRLPVQGVPLQQRACGCEVAVRWVGRALSAWVGQVALQAGRLQNCQKIEEAQRHGGASGKQGATVKTFAA